MKFEDVYCGQNVRPQRQLNNVGDVKHKGELVTIKYELYKNDDQKMRPIDTGIDNQVCDHNAQQSSIYGF